MELNFVEEAIPKITRAGGSGREAEPWEQHLASLKEDDKAGKTFRVWTYAKRTSAVSRMSSVRERLTKAVPEENWKLAVRVVPGTEEATNEDGTSASQFGVYVAFEGMFTPEQVETNAKAHQERSDRVRAARAQSATSGGEGSNGSEDTATSTPTAKERVAAARHAQKATA